VLARNKAGRPRRKKSRLLNGGEQGTATYFNGRRIGVHGPQERTVPESLRLIQGEGQNPKALGLFGEKISTGGAHQVNRWFLAQLHAEGMENQDWAGRG